MKETPNFNQSLHHFLLQQNYTPVLLQQTPTQHFATYGTINNQSMLFIIDTGASHSCLDQQSATEKLHLVSSEIDDDKVIGFGTNEGTRSLSFLETITLGEFLITQFAISVIDISNINQALAVFDFLPIDGIIGADILAQYNALICYENKCMYLRK